MLTDSERARVVDATARALCDHRNSPLDLKPPIKRYEALEEARAALTAALPLIEEAVKPRVKGLVWRDRHANPTRANDLVTESAVGQYAIRPSADGFKFYLYVPGRRYNEAPIFDTVDAALAAAQADYARRILDALEGE